MTTLSGLNGRTALITGAGADAGREIALAFARAGVKVAIHAAPGAGSAEDVANEARSLGVEAAAVEGDVADFDGAGSVVSQAQQQLGPIDIVVHCLRVLPHASVADSSAEEWRTALDVNCSSFFYVVKRLIPGMMERGFGRLIAVGIAMDDRTHKLHASVAAARGALHELVKVAAVETAGGGVTANIVSMAITETTKASVLKPDVLKALVPIARPGKLEEIASACLYLASEQGAYITGHTLHVDGGYTI
jgi:NAD(P)-dependent dehydrogenase (short-subunit alcohol dehydrogenase family)